MGGYRSLFSIFSKPEHAGRSGSGPGVCLQESHRQVNPEQPRSVLIIHPGGLGDVLLSLPAIADIRTRDPGHRIMLLAGSEVGSFLLACGVVDRALSIESGDLACLMSGAEYV